MKKNKSPACLFPCTVLSILLCILATGCGRGKDVSDGLAAENGKTYERIITMSPAVTEIIFAMQQGERVVGVSDYTTYPPEADDLPRCGGFINPNYEIILSLRPDLLITQGAGRDVKDFGERYNIDVVSFQITGLNSIYHAITEMGELLDCKGEAELLAESMQKQIADVEASVKDREPVSTLLVTGRDPGSLREVHVVGAGGFLNDLLVIAGGVNAAGDVGREYFSISKEIVAERAPEVIMELYGEGKLDEQRRERYLKPWQEMSGTPAVRNGRVYLIEETFAMIPGPRVTEIARKMAYLLHEAESSAYFNQGQQF